MASSQDFFFRSSSYTLPLFFQEADTAKYNPLIDAVYLPEEINLVSDKIDRWIYYHERAHRFLAGTKTSCDLRRVVDFEYEILERIWAYAGVVKLRGQSDSPLAEISISEHIQALRDIQSLQESLFGLSKRMNELLATGLWLYTLRQDMMIGKEKFADLKRKITNDLSVREIELLDRFLEIEDRIADHRWDFAASILDYPLLDILHEAKDGPCEWSWLNQSVLQIQKCEVPIFVPEMRLEEALRAIESCLYLGVSHWSPGDFLEYMCRKVPAYECANSYFRKCRELCWVKPSKDANIEWGLPFAMAHDLLAEINHYTCHNLIAEDLKLDPGFEPYVDPTYIIWPGKFGIRHVGEVLRGFLSTSFGKTPNYQLLLWMESLRQQIFGNAPLVCPFSSLGCPTTGCGDVELLRTFWGVVGIEYDHNADICATERFGGTVPRWKDTELGRMWNSYPNSLP